MALEWCELPACIENRFCGQKSRLKASGGEHISGIKKGAERWRGRGVGNLTTH
jgi:hypothetical protein